MEAVYSLSFSPFSSVIKLPGSASAAPSRPRQTHGLLFSTQSEETSPPASRWTWKPLFPSQIIAHLICDWTARDCQGTHKGFLGVCAVYPSLFTAWWAKFRGRGNLPPHKTYSPRLKFITVLMGGHASRLCKAKRRRTLETFPLMFDCSHYKQVFDFLPFFSLQVWKEIFPWGGSSPAAAGRKFWPRRRATVRKHGGFTQRAEIMTIFMSKVSLICQGRNAICTRTVLCCVVSIISY